MQEEKSTKSVNYEKNKRDEKYRHRYSVVVSQTESIQLDKIISDNGCANLSQLCKKIVKGEVTLY